MMLASLELETLLALLGVCLGSFFGVVLDRRNRHASIVWPPSHCASCDRRLRPYELVPVLSYLALRGRCRPCRSIIARRVFMLECAGGVVGVLAALAIQLAG